MRDKLIFNTDIFMRAVTSFFKESNILISNQHIEIIILYYIDLEQLRLISRRHRHRLLKPKCIRTNISTVFSNLPIIDNPDNILNNLLDSMLGIRLTQLNLDKLLYKLNMAFSIYKLDRYLEKDYIFDVSIYNNEVVFKHKLHVCERALLVIEKQRC